MGITKAHLAMTEISFFWLDTLFRHP